MLEVSIPGGENLVLGHIVLDFNGTMALDGVLLPGVEERLNRLAGILSVHVLTADTFGTVREACRGIRGEVGVLTAAVGAGEKERFVTGLSAATVVAVGNGTNDALMLAAAGLGIVVLGPEGTSPRALAAADIVVSNINDGLDLLLSPKRLVASLRA
ncbi:MAG TPA: ATPase P [Spirochaetia bacterium]|nr:ATPase P [Spirochaetia bacterium]